MFRNPKLLGAKTLFATHYHELTELEGSLQGVNNYCIAVREMGEDIVFLRKIVRVVQTRATESRWRSWPVFRSLCWSGPESW